MRFRAGTDGLTVTTPSGEVITYPPGSIVEGVLSRQSPLAEPSSPQLGKDSPFSAKKAAAGIERMIKAGVSLEDGVKMRRARSDKMLRAERDYEDKAG